jgi:Rad3-related DNA helicase
MSDALAPGQVKIGDAVYMTGPRGELVPIEVVKGSDKLQDQLARDLHERAVALNRKLRDFKLAAFAEIDAFLALIDEKYGAKPRGTKGNLTLSSFDGKIQLQVQVADQFRYGPELQSAKTLVDECLNEWAEGVRAEIRALITKAFNVDKEGNVSRASLLALKSYDFQDERWLTAMQAIKDAEVVESTKRYVRFRYRPNADAAWVTVSLDIASA